MVQEAKQIEYNGKKAYMSYLIKSVCSWWIDKCILKLFITYYMLTQLNAYEILENHILVVGEFIFWYIVAFLLLGKNREDWVCSRGEFVHPHEWLEHKYCVE